MKSLQQRITSSVACLLLALASASADDPTFSCNCLDSWTWKNTTYHGCAKSQPHRGPWCMVHPDCKRHGTLPHGDCNGGSCGKWKWCKLSKSKKVPRPPVPPPSDDPACQCVSMFIYHDMPYMGCSMEDSNQPWCVIENESCKTKEGLKASTTPPNLPWKYLGGDICSTTTPSPSTQPLSPLPTLSSSPSSSTSSSPCDCAPTFVYKKKVYMGCSMADSSSPWCVVVSTDCAEIYDYEASTTPPNLPWKYLDREQCPPPTGPQPPSPPALSSDILWASNVTAFSSQWDDANWAATQALFAPDNDGDSCTDRPGSWTPVDSSDTSKEFLQVEFTSANFISQVAIVENYENGFVKQIILVKEDGTSETFDANDTATCEPYEPYFIFSPVPGGMTPYKVKSIKVHTMGNGEIDAVGVCTSLDACWRPS